MSRHTNLGLLMIIAPTRAPTDIHTHTNTHTTFISSAWGYCYKTLSTVIMAAASLMNTNNRNSVQVVYGHYLLPKIECHIIK